MRKLLIVLIMFAFFAEIHPAETVTNPLKPANEGKIKLEEVGTYQLVDEEQEIFPTGVSFYAVNSEGHIYVLSSTVAEVYHYDNSGKFINKFGAKGQGPGEMTTPVSIINAGGDQLAICDAYPAGVHFFDKNGKFIEKKNFETMNQPLSLYRAGDNYFIFRQIVKPSAERTVMQKIIERVDKDMKTLSVVIEGPEVEVMELMANPTKGLFAYAATANGDIFLSEFSSEEYKIDHMNKENELVKSITREFKKVRFNEEEMREIEQRLDMVKKQYPQAQEIFKKLKFPEHRIAIGMLVLDSKERIWAATSSNDPEERASYFDVFTSDGKYVDRIKIDKVKTPVPVVHDDNLYLLETNPELEPFIVKYKIKG